MKVRIFNTRMPGDRGIYWSRRQLRLYGTFTFMHRAPGGGLALKGDPYQVSGVMINTRWGHAIINWRSS